MIRARLPGSVYQKARERPGAEKLSLKEAFLVGASSYLESPRKKKLLLEGYQEERLENLLLMLAQSRASYGVLKSWQATEGKDYAAGREEYKALADALERMEQGVIPTLREEIEALSKEVVKLEAKLRERGRDLEEIEPPFPASVSRPQLASPTDSSGGAVSGMSILRKLWNRLIPG